MKKPWHKSPATSIADLIASAASQISSVMREEDQRCGSTSQTLEKGQTRERYPTTRRRSVGKWSEESKKTKTGKKSENSKNSKKTKKTKKNKSKNNICNSRIILHIVHPSPERRRVRKKP